MHGVTTIDGVIVVNNHTKLIVHLQMNTFPADVHDLPFGCVHENGRSHEDGNEKCVELRNFVWNN